MHRPLLLSACQGELDVSWDAPGCTNVDFDEELVSTLEVEIIDADIVARRTGVEQPCDAVFDPSVSVKGLITAPGTRTYQVWYRNAAAFCTASTFNLSNGVSIVWHL